MYLIGDIGNTDIKICLFNANLKLIKQVRFKTVLLNKNYLLAVSTQVLDGRIFITGKVDDPEEKLKNTKLAWEIQGARSVKNDLKIKEKFNFKQ